MTPFRTACAVLAILGALVSPTGVAEVITGRLILKDGPASGVTISAAPFETPQEEARREARKVPGPSAAASTNSGADGAFSLDLPAAPAGRDYRLRVEGGGIVPGFVPGAYDPGEKIDLGDIFVDKGEPLSGRVLLPEGVPATQVEVILSPRAGSTPSPEPAPMTMHPAADGRFSFDAAHPTANSLVVRADGFLMTPLSRQKSGPVEKIIRLQPVAPLTGVVRKKDGITPAQGALVRVEGDISSRWTETDDSGSFRITSPPASGRRLVADGGSDGVAEIVLGRGASAGAVLTLGLAASVKGRVIDKATRKALPRVRLTVEVAGRLSLTRSRADGTFEAAGLLAGKYAVASDDPRYVPARRGPFSVVAGATLKVDIALVAGASISGRVVDEMGEPVAQAKGLLVPATLEGLRSLIGEHRRPFATGKDGSFQASRLEPGENLRLVVRHPDFEDGAIGSLSLAPGAVRNSLQVVLRRALSAAGIVRDEKGEPVAGADIWLAPEPISTGGGTGPLPYLVGLTQRPAQGTTTAANGRFEVHGLAPGRYRVSAIKAGYSLSAQTPFAIVRGESPKQLELVLLPGAAISGIVRYGDGTPAANRIVAGSIPGAGSGGGGWSQPTGPDGLFTLPSLRVGALYDLDIFEGRLPGAPKVRAVPCPSNGIEILLPTPGRIAGVVSDSGSREPLADFQVWFDRDRSSSQGRSPALFIPGAGQREARGAGFSDRLVVHAEDGAFLLDEVPSGTWEVNVEAKGYQPSRIGGVIVEEGAARSGLRVSLARGAVLRGSVVDARNDRSVSDSRIGISTAGGGTGAGPGSLSREAASRGTDAEGLFEVEGLAPGKYTVTAGHPDFSSASQNVEVGESGASVKISLHSGNRVSGQVLDENKRPVPGAAVGLTTGMAGAGSGFGGGNDQGTLADESGRFRFDHLPAGRYSAIASRQREVTKPVPVVVLDGQPREDVTLVFLPGTVVRGTVTGLPPADCSRVSVYYRGPSGLAGFAKLGADGRFEISGAGEGTLNVSGSLPKGAGGTIRNVSKDVVIAADQVEAEVELAFLPGGAISGNVTQGGRPVPGAFVMASQRGGDGTKNVATGTTEEDGSFRLADLQKGTYGVTARATQYDGIGAQKTVELDGDAIVDLELPTRRVSGVVVEAGSGVPLVDAYVTAAPVTPMVSSTRGASADSTGAFSIERLDAATWTVTASKRGFVFQKQTASLSADDAAELRFEGMRADSIGLHAMDGLLGIPLHALFVRARRADGTTAFQGNVTLDSDGRGEVPSLDPGSYSLDVRGSEYSPALLASVTVPSPPLDVRLTPGGTLEIRAGGKTLNKGTARGRIVGSSGEAYPVTPYTEDGRLTISGPLVRFGHVTPGSYTLTVDGGEPQAFRIAEGGVAVVALP